MYVFVYVSVWLSGVCVCVCVCVCVRVCVGVCTTVVQLAHLHSLNRGGVCLVRHPHHNIEVRELFLRVRTLSASSQGSISHHSMAY